MAIKPTVPDLVKLSFVIFHIRTLWWSALSVRVPGCQKLHGRLLYSCSYMATLGVKGLNLSLLIDWLIGRLVAVYHILWCYWSTAFSQSRRASSPRRGCQQSVALTTWFRLTKTEMVIGRRRPRRPSRTWPILAQWQWRLAYFIESLLLPLI